MEKKFKTKSQRHAYDDVKRRESLQKKLNVQKSQRELIKNALSDSVANKAKKLVFDDEAVEPNENGVVCNSNCFGDKGQWNGVEKPQLFEESDSDGEEKYEIKVKSQFEGKKGHELLHLQSKYSNDERFKLDHRFKDDENDSGSSNEDDQVTSKHSYDETSIKGVPNEMVEEKIKHLKVLETVLGQPIHSTSEAGKKPKKSFFDMVRFDASNADHRRQQNDVGNQIKVESVKKKTKLHKEQRKKSRKEEAEKSEAKNTSKTSESAEKKFFEISEDLKLALKNRQNESSHFSLLATFSKNAETDVKEVDAKDEEVAYTKGVDIGNEIWHEREEEDIEEEEKPVDSGQSTNEVTKEVVKVQGIRKEKFFLTPDDPRIEEGLAFINKKNSDEAGKAIENYDEVRRDIREVLRLRLQKYRQKNNPFKRKIGGSNNLRIPFTKKRKSLKKFIATRRC